MGDRNNNVRRQEFLKRIEQKEKNEERYRMNKKARARAQKRAKQRRKRIGLVAVLATLSFGSVSACTHYKAYKENLIKIEQVLDNEYDAENVGVDDELLEQYNRIREKICSDNIDRDELKDLTDEFINLQLKLTKAKIGNVIGENPGNIKLNPANGFVANITINDSKSKEVDNDMQRCINDIGNLQKIDSKNNYNLSMCDLFTYKNCIKNMDKLITSNIAVDDSGKLVMEPIKKSTLEMNNESYDIDER